MVVSAKKDSDIVRFKELPEVPKAICMKAYGPYERLRGHYMNLSAKTDDRSALHLNLPPSIRNDGGTLSLSFRPEMQSTMDQSNGIVSFCCLTLELATMA